MREAASMLLIALFVLAYVWLCVWYTGPALGPAH
jgi:hypothetical protein